MAPNMQREIKAQGMDPNHGRQMGGPKGQMMITGGGVGSRGRSGGGMGQSGAIQQYGGGGGQSQ